MQQLNSCLKNTKVLWKTIKSIANINSKQTPATELLGTKASPAESVNYVNKYFANIGKQLAENILNVSPPNSHDNNRVLTSASQISSFVLLETDLQEVDSILMSLKTESAPGWDGIQTKFLKMIRSAIVPIICHLTNLIFNQGIFPSSLKKSIVTPVHKGGSKDDVNNFRPISVLPAISKIIEKLINLRLINYLEKFKILSNSQYGTTVLDRESQQKMRCWH